jgi:hypothetical protein
MGNYDKIFQVPNQETLYIYIDESSTLGLKKKEPYFVVCALILSESEKAPLKNSAKRIIRELSEKRQIDEIHASKMSFEEKQFAYNQLADKKFSLAYLVAHKESIHENLFRKKSVCFNYFVYLTLRSLLIETSIENISIIIDMRNIKVTSEKSLEEYLNGQLVQGGIYHKNITVNYGDSKNYYHLQIVDIFANAIYAKYNFSKNHFYRLIMGRFIQRERFPQRVFDKSSDSQYHNK